MLEELKNMYSKHKKLYNVLIILAIGLFFSFWLFGSKLINGHDMEFHLSRIKGIRDSIKIGDLRALIHNGFYGYGYANGIFYGNLPLYIPAIFSLLGVDLINSYKIYIFLSNLASAITMYLCMKKITKSNKAGMIASFLYAAASYRLTDVIVRSAVGEISAFVFAPLVVLGIYEIIYGDKKNWWVFTIGFVGLAECHLISSVLIAVSIIILIIFNYKRLIQDKKRIIYFLISTIAGILVGAHYLFPLLEGLTKNQLVASSISSDMMYYAVPFRKLIVGFPYYAVEDGAFVPGGIGLIYIIITILRFKIKSTKEDKLIKFCDYSLIIAFVFLLCSTYVIPWRLLTKLQFIQFPWRLYLVSTIFFTVSSSIIVYYYLREKKNKFRYELIIVLILVGIVPYFLIEAYTVGLFPNPNTRLGALSSYDGYTVHGGEYLPIETDIDKIKERGEVVTSNNDIEIDFKKKGLSVEVEYSNNNYDNTYIELPLIYYYGYQAIDTKGNKYTLEKGDNGIVRVFLKESNGKVLVYYKGTMIQKISGIVSIFSIVLLVLYIFRNKLKIKNKNDTA